MPDATASLRALALAVREQLLGGGAATLPGLGTLARTHVPARVHTHPDGRKALLPPGETVGLAATPGDPAPLAALVVRHLGTPQADPGGALRSALDQLEARLAATGEARLDGVGTFVRTSGGVRFAAVPALLGDVNRPFSAMPPVGEPPPQDAPPTLTAPPLLAPLPVDVEPQPELETEPPATSHVAGVPVWSIGDAPSAPGSADDAPAGEAPAEPAADDPFASTDFEEPAAWSPPMTPPSDALGMADDIEDADFSLVTDAPAPNPAEPQPDVANLSVPEPADALAAFLDDGLPATHHTPTDDEASAEAATPDDGETRDMTLAESFQRDVPVGVPFGAPLVERVADDSPVVEVADIPPADPAPMPLEPLAEASPAAEASWRWQQAFGWFLILAALSLALALYLWDREPPDAPPVSEPASAPVGDAAPAPVPDAAVALDVPPVTDEALVDEVDSRADEPAPLAIDVPAASAPTRATPATPARADERRLGLPPQRGQAILPPRVAGLPPADVDALASSAGVDARRGGTTWVVLSTASEPDADALAARYRSSGYRTSVLDSGGGGRAYRVAVGQFETREQALRLRDRLPPQAPPDTWPLRLP